jgi:hypothetical protein
MTKRRWFFSPGNNDQEASGSSSSTLRHPTYKPPRPSPPPRNRVYTEVDVTRTFPDQGVPLSWPDVHLPHRWHLNQSRVPMPAIPRVVRGCRHEILRQRAFLPADLCRVITPKSRCSISHCGSMSIDPQEQEGIAITLSN